MPCHPHHFTKPSAALLGTTSALLRTPAGRSAMVQHGATYGIAADKLLTGLSSSVIPPARSCRQQRARAGRLRDEQPIPASIRFSNICSLVSHGGTWHDPDLAGRSRRRWSGVGSCSASTWPSSARWSASFPTVKAARCWPSSMTSGRDAPLHERRGASQDPCQVINGDGKPEEVKQLTPAG
jgi:hypothetical protein